MVRIKISNIVWIALLAKNSFNVHIMGLNKKKVARNTWEIFVLLSDHLENKQETLKTRRVYYILNVEV